MKKNDIIKLHITDLTGGGDGVSKADDGRVVFVPNTAVGDVIEALIIKVKTKYALGKISKILEPSPDRITSDCIVSSRCGGCVFRHINYAKECEIKYSQVYNSIRRIGGIEFTPDNLVTNERINGYRNKAQYPIGKDKDGNIICGFFTKSSHRLVECSNCLLQPKVFTDITRVFCEWANENRLTCYDESAGKGLLRHLYLRYGEVTRDIMIVVVINGGDLPYSDSLKTRLLDLLGNNLKSLQLNINTMKTNVVLGDMCKTLYGNDYITDILCGVELRISPLSFYQVNHSMAERLYDIAKEYAEPTDKIVLDLYCGTGAIGLSMANVAKRIVGVEIVPAAVEDAKLNAKVNNIENAEFLCMDATEAAEVLKNRGEAPDIVILDPPRKGCTEELLNTVANDFSPERIVYISCNDATFARDCAILEGLGYKLIKLTPVDLFPRTGHVETVALLSRQIGVHKMKLNPVPFEMIKSGEKTIELRLFDEKRQQIKTGDKIVFTKNTNGETLNRTVAKLHIFDSFKELYKSLPLLQCGYIRENIDKATPSDMEQYYSVEEQNKYGVVGIELCRSEQITDE